MAVEPLLWFFLQEVLRFQNKRNCYRMSYVYDVTCMQMFSRKSAAFNLHSRSSHWALFIFILLLRLERKSTSDLAQSCWHRFTTILLNHAADLTTQFRLELGFNNRQHVLVINWMFWNVSNIINFLLTTSFFSNWIFKHVIINQLAIPYVIYPSYQINRHVLIL